VPSLQVDISPFLQKAQYDKVTCKIPCHTALFAVILSEAKYPYRKWRINYQNEIYMDFSLSNESSKRQCGVLLCASNAFVAVTPCLCKGQRQKRRVNPHFKSLFYGEIYKD